MKPLSLATIAAMAGGTLAQGVSDTLVSAVATDTRAMAADALFIALRGDSFDGHEFAAAAAGSGAVALMVEASSMKGPWPSATGVITVDDTLLGLQSLAAAYRRELNPRVVAITGSNGKTTAKEFTRAVLSARFQVHATRGNFNNHIGLPLTMLSQEPGQTHGVYELGMNHPGEIASLAGLARPDIAMVTTMGGAHIEFFGTRRAIAEEKMALFSALSPEGVAVINLESDFADLAMERAPGRVVTVGIKRGDIQAREIGPLADGRMRFTLVIGGEEFSVCLPVPGKHMVQNALLALAVGWIEGVPAADAAAALETGRLAGGRLQVKGWRGATLIDDTYNANPDSMKAALNTLAAQPSNARRIAILGGMGELGEHSDQGHEEVGRHAASLGLDVIATVGVRAERIARAAGPKALVFTDHASCARWLEQTLETGDVVLLKGSRGSAMEKVLQALEGVPLS